MFRSLGNLRDAFVAEWITAAGGFASAHIASLQPYVFRELDRHRALESAGWVLSADALTDRRRHLEWWQRGTATTYQPLILEVEPDAIDCYDYYAMDWFDAAVRGAPRCVSGPLIDLPCADVYIMTFALPMHAGATLLGVAAADVGLARFESQVLPPLRLLDRPAALLNREHRVITSNDPTWATGDRLRDVRVVTGGTWGEVVDVGADLGWTLAIGS